MANPLVSLICPTWNRPQFLLQAVRLFQAQTYQECELIVVDDSDKGSAPDLSHFRRVKHLKIQDKLSLGEKHNIGHSLAQGEIFGFWDDDDWFGPRRLVMQLDPLVRKTAEIVGFRRGVVLQIGDPVTWWDILPRANHRSWIGNGALNFLIPIHDGSALYRREILRAGVRFPHRTMNEKVDFLNLAVKAGATWTVIPNEGIFVYVRHGKNTWRYNEALVHAAVPKPSWFPDEAIEFYRKAVA